MYSVKDPVGDTRDGLSPPPARVSGWPFRRWYGYSGKKTWTWSNVMVLMDMIKCYGHEKMLWTWENVMYRWLLETVFRLSCTISANPENHLEKVTQQWAAWSRSQALLLRKLDELIFENQTYKIDQKCTTLDQNSWRKPMYRFDQEGTPRCGRTGRAPLL